MQNAASLAALFFVVWRLVTDVVVNNRSNNTSWAALFFVVWRIVTDVVVNNRSNNTYMANIFHCSYCIIRYEIHLHTSCVAAFMLILHRNNVCDICIFPDGNISITTTPLVFCFCNKYCCNPVDTGKCRLISVKIKYQLYYNTHMTRHSYKCITFSIVNVITYRCENTTFIECILWT